MKTLLTLILSIGLLAGAGTSFAETETGKPKAPEAQSGKKEKKDRPGAPDPEVQKHREKMKEMTPEERREYLKNMDPEDREALQAKRKEMRDKMRERFDADGDGKLSPEERATMRETLEKEGVELPKPRPEGKKDKPGKPKGPKPGESAE